MSREKRLTPRQEMFVREYIKDFNGTQAAIRAGYSPRSAHVQSTTLLNNPKVRAALDKNVEKRQQRVEVEADDVLRMLLEIATVDLSQAYTEDGKLKNIHDMPAEVRRAIAGVETISNGSDDNEQIVRKVRFWDKPKTIELIGRHLAMFTDKHVVEDRRVKLVDMSGGQYKADEERVH